MADDTPKTWWGRFLPEAASPVREPDPSGSSSVPRGMRVAAAWSWRILLVAAVVALLVFLVVQLRLIVIPLLIAVLVSALLKPVVDVLVRHRWPKGLAIALAMVGTLAVVSGLIFLAISQITSQFASVQARTMTAYGDFKAFLLASPLHVTEAQLNDFIAQAFSSLQQDSQVLLSGALSIGSTLGHVATGVFLTLFCLLFMLIDGRTIWRWTVRVFPQRARPAVDSAGRAGWRTLGNYVRTQILVASIDAVGIGLGAFILGVPLAIPVAVLVFLGSFVPIVGAVVTGAVAVFLALVYNGPLIALLMLGVVLLVQQLEGHVLQPLIMGTAVKVHPLAVVLAVAGGTLVAGIPGALFAVPVVAVINVMVHTIASGTWRTGGTPPPEPATDGAIWQTVPSPRRIRPGSRSSHEPMDRPGDQEPQHPSDDLPATPSPESPGPRTP
ncbi:AI-2E family transporter [Plantibacter sp. VKM Ac-2880]|uniref:AI-2E family transporter n=1 Tax=Plantibacter sp. VKM Ac-2880 TaxID=2783827 RepID=UPI00188EE64C|nr:AI-2E family transporter [Plantibacter sp. VKM Ac-2880]MBF4568642.1 AI-2E family transporter [Plantibacter sp. VKM Ac-2880]